MKKHIETGWFYWVFENKHSQRKSDSKNWGEGFWEYNYWRIDKGSIEKGLKELAEYCNKNAYEIKGIIPIDRAQSYEYGQGLTNTTGTFSGAWGAGLGQGWGITITDGFAAILQRIELLTDEEYDARLKAEKLKKDKVEAERRETERREAEKQNIEKAIEEIKGKIAAKKKVISESNTVISKGIVEKKKGMLNKTIVFKVGKDEFENIEEAEKLLSDLKSMTEDYSKEITTLHEKMEKYKVDLEQLNENLKKQSCLFEDANRYSKI